MLNVLKGYEIIPTEVATLLELWQCVSDIGKTAADTERTVRSHPVIAGSVVAFGNLPCFGAQKPTNLQSALRRMDSTDLVKAAAQGIAASLYGGLRSVYPIQPWAPADLPMASGILMEFLAHEVDTDPLEAFLAGLFHCAGQLPIAHLLPRIKPGQRAPAVVCPHELARWERQELGLDHAKIGGLILDQWGFPGPFVTAIASYLHPALAGKSRQLSALTLVARMTAPNLLSPLLHRFEDIEYPLPLLTLAGLRPTQIAVCLPRAHAWWRSTRSLSRPLTHPPFRLSQERPA